MSLSLQLAICYEQFAKHARLAMNNAAAANRTSPMANVLPIAHRQWLISLGADA